MCSYIISTFIQKHWRPSFDKEQMNTFSYIQLDYSSFTTSIDEYDLGSPVIDTIWVI